MRPASLFRVFETLGQDTRYAARGLRRSPGVTVAVILTLALGIGANTGVFSLLYQLMLRPLPVHEPDRLVELLSHYPADPRLNQFDWKYYEHFRDRNTVFSGLTGVGSTELEVQVEGGAQERLLGGYVPGNFFAVLGLEPASGRLITPRDDQMGSADAAVAVVSWSYWNRLSRDSDILGNRIVINGVPAAIIGVARRGFRGLQVGAPQHVWVPASMAARDPSLALIARLKPGVTIEQAQAEMRVLDRWRVEDLAESSPTRDPVLRQIRLDLEPAAAGFSRLRDRFGRPLLALMAVVGLLLLLMCVNVSSMLLAKAAAREREMAVRVSLGAGRLRLLRQALAESLLLSAVAATAGVGLAYLGADTLVRILASGRRLPGAPPIEMDVQPDAQVLLFAVGAAVVTAVLFGLVPALRAMQTAPASFLRASGRSSESRSGRMFSKGLVVAQVALSVVLLSAAGLFAGHLSNLRYVGVGFERDNILLVTLGPPAGEQPAAATQDLLGRLEALPGVRSASLVGAIPTSGAAAADMIEAEGFQERQEDRRYVHRNGAGPNYFRTMGTALLAGREFGIQDANGPRVAIVNRALADHYFDGRDPIGKHVTFERNQETHEIVGVVGDAKYTDLRETAPRTIYLPTFRARNLVLRTDFEPAALEEAVRRVVGDSFLGDPVEKVTTMAALMDESIVPERLVAGLSSFVGSLGAAIAAIGLYGLLAYVVSRRVSEIGVRMALGASPRAMTAMILRDALVMVGAGLALGLPLSFFAKRFAGAVFGGLTADDPTPLIGGAAVMLAVGLLAGYLPGRRAGRVDPIEALRHE